MQLKLIKLCKITKKLKKIRVKTKEKIKKEAITNNFEIIQK